MAEIGHNSGEDARVDVKLQKALLRQALEARAKIKEAQVEFKEVMNSAKDSGVKMKAFRVAVSLAERMEDNPEKVIAEEDERNAMLDLLEVFG